MEDMGGPVTGGSDRGEDASTAVGAEGSLRSRPWVERLGMAAVALVLSVLFGAVAVFAWLGGEVFLAVMAGIGALMTVWAGGMSLRRG